MVFPYLKSTTTHVIVLLNKLTQQPLAELVNFLCYAATYFQKLFYYAETKAEQAKE